MLFTRLKVLFSIKPVQVLADTGGRQALGCCLHEQGGSASTSLEVSLAVE